METTSETSPTSTQASERPARTRKPPTARARRAKTKSGETSRSSDASPTESPFLSIDAEMLADLQDVTMRKVQAIVRDQPMLALGGAFAGGFIVGGGWRTRLGRFMLLAAGRYVVVQAAETYFASR